MPGLIDSAPSCIAKVDGAKPADDTADFIVQAPYLPCQEDAGGAIMTFGPGSTFGAEGTAATTEYYALTWIGIVFMLVVIVWWVVYENRSLLAQAARLTAAKAVAATTGSTSTPPDAT
jgi:hypothetical protein